MFDVERRVKDLIKSITSKRIVNKKMTVEQLKKISYISNKRDRYILSVAAEEIKQLQGCNCMIHTDKCIENCQKCIEDYLYDKVESKYRYDFMMKKVV